MTPYSYRCAVCGDEMDVDCPMGQAPASLPCSSCGARAARLYASSAFSRSSANAEDVWNASLGIAHRNDRQAAEHIKKLNDTEGTHYTLQ